MTAYSASKAFDDFLSRGLQAEYSSKGLIIQSVQPGVVKTNMTKPLSEVSGVVGFLAVEAEEFVRQALKTVGVQSRTYGHWLHALEMSVFSGIIAVVGERGMVWLLHFLLRRIRKNISNNK